MREREYSPLLANGFKDIVETELHKEFVSSFTQGYTHREGLLANFIAFLNEFKTLNLTAEVWIDGSFATTAPDPADVDVVFYLIPSQIENRKFIKNLYQVEVFYGEKDNQADYTQWQGNFGTCYDNQTPKGIFRIHF
jgi:hypothetical protein